MICAVGRRASAEDLFRYIGQRGGDAQKAHW
jgi:hypothetical protein